MSNSNPSSTNSSSTNLSETHPDDNKLSPEDQARVDRYLASPIHSVERKPFRTLYMMVMLVGVVVALGGLSMLISWIVL